MNPQLQLATALVALLSLIIATSSLTWNVVQYLLTGSRPKAVLLVGVLAPGGVVSGQPGPGMRETLDRLARDEGYTQRVVGVQVINRGRSPTRVQRWSVKTPQGGGISLVPLGDVIGPALPHTLEPGAQESWYVELRHAAALVSATTDTFGGSEEPVHCVVELGSGRSLRTDRSIRVGSGPSGPASR